MAPTKKNAKATRKFEKKHLKGVLEKRKATAKIKQREQIKNKKKARRAKDAEFTKGSKTSDADATNGSRNVGSKSGTMSVDDFFQGGFEMLEPKKSKLGKRKRQELHTGDGEATESIGDALAEAASSEDEILDREDGDDGSDAEGAMSKEVMDQLAEKDPEFYNFLKENDPEALDFDMDADFAGLDELSGSDGDESAQDQPKEKPKKGERSAEANELTVEMVAGWKKSLEETHSLRAAREVVIAFRAAAHLNEVEEEGSKGPKYKISSPDAFNDILILALTQIPPTMNHHLPVKESSSGKLYVPSETKKFKTLSGLLTKYTSAIIHLLGSLSDAKTLNLTLSGLTPVLPYLLSFRKLVKALIRSVVGFWSQPASAETTRITAFLVIRRLFVIGDKGVRETILKTIYQGLVQGSRVTNPNTLRGINLMKNSAAELWGLDESIGYVTGFNFIRQLAIHLRNSIVHNKNDAFRAVYNWQYTHSLDFWSCVLSENCSSDKASDTGKDSQLKLLIYPLVQVTLGAMRLIPTSMYFPLRFHLTRSLLRISRATGTYIPLASVLIEVLDANEMRKPPKPSTLKSLDFATNYKAPKSYLGTRVYQDGLGDQVVELLGEYLVLWATSIAFPEFSLPVVVQLKRWLKQARRAGKGNKNQRATSALAVLIQKVEASAKVVEQRRANVDFAPKDRAQVDAFMRNADWEKTPLGAYIVAQRKAGAERARLLEEARLEENRKRKDDEDEEMGRAVDASDDEDDFAGMDSDGAMDEDVDVEDDKEEDESDTSD